MMINLNAPVPISVFAVQWIGIEAFDHEKTSFAQAHFEHKELE